MEDIVLLGCGGHAKSIVDVIERQFQYRILGFIDNSEDTIFEYRGYKIIGKDNDLPSLYSSGVNNAFICIGYIGNSTVRESLYFKLKEIGFSLPIIIDDSSILASDITIGEGTFIGKKAILNSSANIGEMSIINTGAIVEHDCNIEAFSHVAVGAVLCGNVGIGRSCLIGANSTVIQNIKIGNKAIVGAGSIVLTDIKDNQTVVGLFKK